MNPIVIQELSENLLMIMIDCEEHGVYYTTCTKDEYANCSEVIYDVD